MRFLSVSLALCLLALGGGCGLYSESTVYEVAREAVKKDPKLPANAVIAPAKNGDFYIGKSAACVYVPYEFTDPAGAKHSATYTVWLDRICIRWEVNRCFPSPTYTKPGPLPGS
jgi:hypothetical protein